MVCDTSLPFPARAAALTALLTPQEKAAWLQNGQVALPRHNLSSWEFGAEALHGLQGNCITAADGTGANVTRCPSSFPAGPALGSSFNRSLLHMIGEAIGDEVRATVNLNVPRAYGGELLVPSVWMPNLNVLRDPRWGRNQEAFSEDPFVIGTLGAQIVHGTARGTDGFDAKYLKVIVIAKHATGYQIENDRFGYNPNFSPHDIASTNLQAWELTASKATPGQGGFNGYMCAYDSVFGQCVQPARKTARALKRALPNPLSAPRPQAHVPQRLVQAAHGVLRPGPQRLLRARRLRRGEALPARRG